MWLTSSSVGRKFIMALTGACLVLFVTFHCVMNAIALVWPTAYNMICEFLGANWYALVASMGLALLFIIHIIWATMLTIQNRRARGVKRYSISANAPGVEWSSKNMYVLGGVVVAFLVVHLINFWAKMQLAEIQGTECFIPAQAGTLFLQESFSTIWVPVVYIIGFVALWFHMNHGFWSMFQTCGWNNEIWIQRLKKIGCWWTGIVVCLFVAQAIVFTVQANKNYYKTNDALRNQYLAMVFDSYDMSDNAQGIQYAEFARQIEPMYQQISTMSAEQKNQIFKQQPEAAKQFELIERLYRLVNYLEGRDPNAEPAKPQTDPYMMQMMQQQASQGAPEEGDAGQQASSSDAEQAAQGESNTPNN